MAKDDQNNQGDDEGAGLMTEIICQGIIVLDRSVGHLFPLDTNIIAHETKDLMVEAKSSFTILICSLLFMSLLSILLSTWLAKTITNSPTSFGSIVSHYFRLERNSSESDLTWWTPVHQSSLVDRSQITRPSNQHSHPSPLKIPYNDYPNFHRIVLPLLFIGSVLLAILAFYARVKCTHRDFAWGAVPKIPLDRVVEPIPKAKEPTPAMDYAIVQGTTNEPVVFAVVEPVEAERQTGDIVDEGTQYELEDIPK